MRVIALRDRDRLARAVGGCPYDRARVTLIEDHVNIFAVGPGHRCARASSVRDGEFDPAACQRSGERHFTARSDRDTFARGRHPRRADILKRLFKRAQAGLLAIGHQINRKRGKLA
ncbi:MAG: hypothetical protein AAFR28_19435 [Pseudomonadota bacterium]